MLNKPTLKIEGQDGNIFSVMGAASKALKKNNQYEKAIEMQGKVIDSNSYIEALSVISEYIDWE